MLLERFRHPEDGVGVLPDVRQVHGPRRSRLARRGQGEAPLRRAIAATCAMPARRLFTICQRRKGARPRSHVDPEPATHCD